MTPDVSIAVVNNEPALLEALKFNLERSGYRVRAYGNSADVLDALIAFPADLVITDGSNSPFDGVELFRRLRGHTNVPVIFVSAWAQEIEEHLRATTLLAADYIQLPFSMADLLRRVKLIVEKRMSERRAGTP